MRKQKQNQHIILFHFIIIRRRHILKFDQSYWKTFLVQNLVFKDWENKQTKKPNKYNKRIKTYMLFFHKLSYKNAWQYSYISNEKLQRPEERYKTAMPFQMTRLVTFTFWELGFLLPESVSHNHKEFYFGNFSNYSNLLFSKASKHTELDQNFAAKAFQKRLLDFAESKP